MRETCRKKGIVAANKARSANLQEKRLLVRSEQAENDWFRVVEGVCANNLSRRSLCNMLIVYSFLRF